MSAGKAGGLRIRTKLILITALFTAVILAVIWLLFVVFLDDFYRLAKNREIMKAAYTVESLLDNDANTLADEIAGISRATDANILIRKYKNGKFESVSYLKPRDILVNSSAVNAIIESAQNEGGQITYTFNGQSGAARQSGENDSMLYAKIIEKDDFTAAILISVQLTPVNATKTTIAGMLIIVSAVSILTAVIIASVLARTLSAPLTKLTVSAKDIGTPAYKKLDGRPGCRETAELNETLGKASAELQKVDDLRRELIANVSHDLRTPLTMISGYGEMMRDIPGENNADNIQIIIDEADHLNRLVNDLLSLSKLESGMEKIELSEFNVTAALKELVGRYSTMRAVQGYTIDFEYEKEYVIKGDEIKLTQVFYNLINNAINYTGDSMRVLIKQTETKDGRLRFDVIDDGDGILPENLPYIWDRYFKENRAHKRAGVGTGLGLSIVKKIIEAHGGAYGVISEPGKGADFYIELPV